MYIEIIDLIWTTNRLMIVRPYEVELVVVCLITSIFC
jgi:hypothetical protein